jgi:hypothetical protein
MEKRGFSGLGFAVRRVQLFVGSHLPLPGQ